MILLLLALQAVAVQPPPLSSRLKFYNECVERSALQFENAGETVDATVKAAFAACSGERALLILSMSDPARKSDGNSMPFDQALPFVAKVIDQRLSDDLTRKLFSIRSQEK